MIPSSVYDLYLSLADSIIGPTLAVHACAHPGRFQEAEAEFLAAGRSREALDMWLHARDWAAARAAAPCCGPDALAAVAQAQVRTCGPAC